ncbi:MAG: GntR family transcriptional regulator, transcriptional repressor for pyruvate dehydrogenase complex [Propionibacteriaceae bacterium]|jgi:GntR family transcriptional repressor for pyruvate dehydrogenase complex|nr:GntR family transcriptional regulator [Propionibacteriaceae bacterium]MDX6322537.1 GntR family transcriptional regulator, transcriptional repressor for pyruvate dehydrogenase complex [Propionibacteriaceae bacterium]
MIASGRLGAGQRFPIESHLCEELGVSRSSLREAVRMLAALGVVEVRQGAGTYVSQLQAADIVSSLTLTVGLLPLEGLLEIYELRRVLEGHAASQAAARRTDEFVVEMEALLVELEACTDPDETAELDHRFHAMFASAAGNPTLASLLGVFRSRSRNYQIFTFPSGPEIKRVSDEGHRAIANAISARDAGAAASAASAHVAQTEVWLRRLQPPPAPRVSTPK